MSGEKTRREVLTAIATMAAAVTLPGVPSVAAAAVPNPNLEPCICREGFCCWTLRAECEMLRDAAAFARKSGDR